MDLRSMELAHDMKMPIQLIYSCVQLLEMEITPNARTEGYLKMLTQSAGQLQMMVHNVLESDRQQRGISAMHFVQRDVAGETREVCRQCDLFAREENKRVMFSANASPLPMITDVEKLDRILQNLISNALKVTPEGGRVRVQLEALGDAVEICVCDDGPGIPANRLDRIFHLGETDGGYGYGLAIVRQYAGMLNGSVRVESVMGKGSRFILRLPFQGAEHLKSTI